MMRCIRTKIDSPKYRNKNGYIKHKLCTGRRIREEKEGNEQ